MAFENAKNKYRCGRCSEYWPWYKMWESKEFSPEEHERQRVDANTVYEEVVRLKRICLNCEFKCRNLLPTHEWPSADYGSWTEIMKDVKLQAKGVSRFPFQGS